MNNSITYNISEEELGNLGYKQEDIAEARITLECILAIFSRMKTVPKQKVLIVNDKNNKDITKLSKNTKAVWYELLERVENNMTDFKYGNDYFRLCYEMKDGRTETIPVLSNYYLAPLQTFLSKIWFKHDK